MKNLLKSSLFALIFLTTLSTNPANAFFSDKEALTCMLLINSGKRIFPHVFKCDDNKGDAAEQAKSQITYDELRKEGYRMAGKLDFKTRGGSILYYRTYFFFEKE